MTPPLSSIIAFTTLLAILASASSALAQVVVRFSPPVVEVPVGGTATAQVVVEGVPTPGVAAIQIDLGYDQAIALVGDPNDGSGAEAFSPLGDDTVLCEAVRGVTPCPDPPWLLVSTGRSPLGTSRSSTAGHQLFAYGTSGTAGLPLGDGAIGVVSVQGVQPGATLVMITNAIVADDSDVPTPFAVVVDPLIVVVGSGLPDQDADGVPDSVDNCVVKANGTALPEPLIQEDGDRDGYGNFCDADLNNDFFVDFQDLGVLKSRFLTPDPVADFNGDGFVDFQDLSLQKSLFFQAPGPSGRAP